MNNSRIEIYRIDNENSEISVKLEGDTVWLNLIQMTDLFQRDKSVISRHIILLYQIKFSYNICQYPLVFFDA